jgi:hypothetical protein
MYITPIFLIIIIAMMLGLYYCLTMTSNKIKETFVDSPNQEEKEIYGSSRDPVCPDTLIERDGKIVLFSSNLEKVPGVNPIIFDNLEEYVEFTEWQRSKGITCPVLYLQNTNDAQGNNVYKVRPSIIDPQGGLPPVVSRPDPQINIIENSNPNEKPGVNIQDVNDTMYFRNGGGNITGEQALNTGPHNIGYVNANLPNNNNEIPGFTQSDFYQGTITPMDVALKKQQEQDVSPSATDSNWGGENYTNSMIEQGAYEGRTVKM